ncbi:MAG: extracellular solute-binding protein [Roseiflexaceae bacterium]|nr:extracellular solute-binding protein [Roseiflexus sp.]MDW8213150.1 extracellular solute-binding protein [Roseiflexaceae bacterium]
MRCRLVAILLVAALLAGCESNSAPETSSVPTIVANASSVGPLLLWHGWSGNDRQALGRLVEQYNRQRSDGRIVLQSVPLASFAAELRAAVAAGSGPHLILIPNTWIGGLAEAGVLLPLDDLIPAQETDTLLPVTLAGAQARDAGGALRLYGAPVRFDTIALYYNAANLTVPPEDTATMLAVGRGLSDPEAQPPIWGLALNLSHDNMIGYLYAFDGRIFDDEGRVALGTTGRAGAEQWLAWLTGLQNDPRILARSESSILVDRELKDGRAIMTFDWAHQIGMYRGLWGEQVGVAPLPRLSETGKAPRPYVRADVLAINSLAGISEREAAARFIRFMISTEAQSILLQSDMQPASRALALTGDSPQEIAARVFRAQAEQGLPMSNASARAFVEQEIRRMQRQALLGLTTPADAVTEADRRLRERLEP